MRKEDAGGLARDLAVRNEKRRRRCVPSLGLAKNLTGRYAERQMRDFIKTIGIIAGSLNDRTALPFLLEKFG